MPNVRTILLASEAEAGQALPAEPWVYGLTAFVILGLLLLVTPSFGKDR